MPVVRCQIDGKQGWKWGNSGKCYTGPNARARAAAQGAAAHAAGFREKNEVSQVADQFDIKKSDGELQIVWGEVYAPDVPDSQGDFMVSEEIRKMAHGFMAKGRTSQVDVMHDNMTCGCSVVESFIAREDDPLFIPGSWVVGVHVPNPSLWQAIKSGEYNGFSMQALAIRTPSEVVLEIPERLHGKTDEAENHTHEFAVKYDDDGNFIGGNTSVVAGHFHAIKRGTISEETMEHSHKFSFVEEVKAHAAG